MASAMLDFDKPLSELPPSHIWPLSSIHNHPCDTVEIPIIDMKNPDVAQVRYACEEWGFFTIINHSVSEKLLEDFKVEIDRLFSLPTDAKTRVLRSPEDPSGYEGLPVEKFSPNRMWHEGFGIRSSLHEHASKLWPPHGNPKFYQVMEEYQKALKTVAEEVLTLMLASLGLTPNDTNWAGPKTNQTPFGPNGAHLQLNSYPPCPDPDHAMGLTQHTDSSIVTVLNQVNDASGLQVLHAGKWVNVGPIPGSFVINSGDLAHFLFNGRFVSPVHRVVPNRTGPRYSAAFFYGPPFGAPIGPLRKLVGPGRGPVFKEVTWQSYVKVKHEGVENAFEFVRVKGDEVEE